MIQLHNIIGLVGVVMVLVAYYLLQVGKLAAHGFLYSLLNAVSSCFILWSLFHAWNLSAALIEICWLIISAYGLIKYFKQN